MVKTKLFFKKEYINNIEFKKNLNKYTYLGKLFKNSRAVYVPWILWSNNNTIIFEFINWKTIFDVIQWKQISAKTFFKIWESIREMHRLLKNNKSFNLHWDLTTTNIILAEWYIYVYDFEKWWNKNWIYIINGDFHNDIWKFIYYIIFSNRIINIIKNYKFIISCIKYFLNWYWIKYNKNKLFNNINNEIKSLNKWGLIELIYSKFKILIVFLIKNNV